MTPRNMAEADIDVRLIQLHLHFLVYISASFHITSSDGWECGGLTLLNISCREMNTRTFTIILQINTDELNAYDLRHLTVNLRVCGLKLRFNLQSSPVEGNFPQQDSNKISWQIVHIIEVPLSPPHFLCEEILFKLLAFSYAITRKSEESSRRKSLPVLYTPSVGPSRLRILSPLINKEEQWFESLHERRTEVRNCDPIPFDGFQKGLRTILRIHSGYQDEP